LQILLNLLPEQGRAEADQEVRKTQDGSGRSGKGRCGQRRDQDCSVHGKKG
jgi:hypothetical protein